MALVVPDREVSSALEQVDTSLGFGALKDPRKERGEPTFRAIREAIRGDVAYTRGDDPILPEG